MRDHVRVLYRRKPEIPYEVNCLLVLDGQTSDTRDELISPWRKLAGGAVLYKVRSICLLLESFEIAVTACG